ncbi:uncharacterized protein si:cabz01007807.1 isoform X4 [Thunnus maccoyii]|uniref:uncharacterized protein si:cabz01007807.1 isoform X4 n=1 Tax=Thunnus maccoyii TaxID=8240 RepID=UPI001C4DA223|nr:uncharacterized protein si:cabz01007807.1 isoform X4 [Thunnus maccoyii]
MRGDTTTENGEEADHHGESAATERRPSIVTLQNMLKRVSQSPFHNQYNTLVSSTSDSSGSSANESQNKQDDEFLSDLSAAATDVIDNRQLHFGQKGLKMDDNNLLPAAPQNGVSRGLARSNPFYTDYLESGSKSNGTDDVGRKTSGEVSLDTIFVPPPEFQSSPLDFQQDSKTMENGAKCSEPEKDLFQTLNHNPMQDLFQTSMSAQNASANGHYHDVTLNSPETNPPQTQNLSKNVQSKDSDLFKGEVENLFHAVKGESSHHAAHAKEVNLFDKSPSIFVDPFKSPSNKEDDLFQSPQCAAVNPFYSATTKETLLCQAVPTESGLVRPKSFSMNDRDVFSPSSTNTFDPFPSPITRDLFQDVSNLDDPFGTTPSKQYDPFKDDFNGTPDIFQPLPSNTVNNSDISKITPSNTASKATYSTPSLSSLSEINLDKLSSPDLFKATPSEPLSAIQTKSSNMPHEIVLMTPQGTKHDILQPTPFSQARNLSVSPSQSPAEMTHMQTFKRPPKPLPRTRPPRREKPPGTEKPPRPEKPSKPAKPVEPEPTVPNMSPKTALRPLPKPVIRRKPKTQEYKPMNPESYVVFEDILLTGQERCVEDWPEDSPELNSDFQPSGKFRLRRESLKVKVDSDGGSGEDQDGSGSHSKKKDRKFRVHSILPRRGSKDKFPDDTKEGRSRTLPTQRKSSKEYFSEIHMSPEENDDGDEYGMDYKKKPLKAKVNQLLRRASIPSSVPEGKCMNRHLPQESKDDDINTKTLGKKNSIIRRWSEGTVLENSTGEEEEEGGEAQHEEKTKKKMKIKFVPHRGFVISVEKNDEELKGAHGYTPRKGSNKSQEEIFGTHGYTPRKKSQDDVFEDVEEIKGHTLQSTSKAAFLDDEYLQKTYHMSPGLNGDEDTYGMEDCKPKKHSIVKLLHMGRRSSKEDMLDDNNPKKSSFSAEELDDEELYGMEDCKPKKSKHKGPIPLPRKSKTTHEATGQSELIGFRHSTPQHAANDGFAEDEFAQTGKDFMSPREMYDIEQDELEICKPVKRLSRLKGLKKHKAKSKAMQLECEDPPGATCSDYLSEAAKDGFAEDEFTQTGKDFMSPREMYDTEQDELEICKPKKLSKLKGLKKYKAKSKAMQLECEDPPGATCSDYLSEAAKAEWLAAQMDERAMAGLEDGDEEGDTDSLMEWWYTVEKWDEVPSDDEEKVIKEDESKSFTILADKVNRGLRVFNKVFTERAEVLWHSVITLHAIADDISNFHHKAKIAGITGGTTTAVGGVTAIAGLALAPFTFGASLVVTAVGVGVATAGGITSASAAISDNVNNMHDRKKVETVLQEYEDHLLDIGKILHFVNQGLYKLRGHPFLRSGTQHYSEDWEVRRAVQMISLVDSPVMRATEITDTGVASVQGLFKGMDKYFLKDSRELKKGCKKEVVGQIKEVANILNDGIVELNSIREELQDATGNM